MATYRATSNAGPWRAGTDYEIENADEYADEIEAGLLRPITEPSSPAKPVIEVEPEDDDDDLLDGTPDGDE